jgi:hypothetical protein
VIRDGLTAARSRPFLTDVDFIIGSGLLQII